MALALATATPEATPTPSPTLVSSPALTLYGTVQADGGSPSALSPDLDKVAATAHDDNRSTVVVSDLQPGTNSILGKWSPEAEIKV